MPTSPARFRISIKDQHTGNGLKVELIDSSEVWGERRYRIRLNGHPAAKVPEVTLTEVCDRLRRWVVGRANRPALPTERRLHQRAL